MSARSAATNTFQPPASLAASLAANPGWALAILNDAADGVLAIDESGIVQWLNPAAERLFGYSADELVGRSVNLLMPQPDRDRHDSYIANYLRTGQRKIIGIGREVIGQRKDGAIFPMYLSVCESFIGERRVFGGIVRDLTQRKAAEESLRRERDFSRRLLDTAEVIVLLLDARGRIVLFNGFLERLCGRTFDDVRERDWVENFVPERDQARARWLLKQSLSGQRLHGNIYPVRTRDGGERQIEWFESTIDMNGRGLLCIGLDVTERIEAEQERYAYEEKLRSLTAELISSEERERRELAAELHDHIGQSLALAKIKLGALRESAPSELRAQVDELRELVGAAVRASRSIMTELGATILHELGLEAALADVAEDTQQRFGLVCSFSDDRQEKPLDEQLRIALFRAARELLMNVVKHANAKRATLEIRRIGHMLRIRVVDDGVGFIVPPGGFHASKEGGFGLFSIQERLARLGGSMTVESSPGCGASVTLEAPVLRSLHEEDAA